MEVVWQFLLRLRSFSMSAAPNRAIQSEHLGGVFGDPEGKAGYFNAMDCCSMS